MKSTKRPATTVRLGEECSVVFARGSSILALLMMAWAVPTVAAPQRIVSLYPCLDTILVHVAEHDQIAALSYYARDQRSSTIADIAAKLPMTYGTAEEVIALRPDLVISSKYGAAATHQALKRLNVPVAEFDVPLDVASSIGQVRAMAQLVGQPARGEVLVREIESALLSVPHRDAVPALMFQSNGFFAGRGVLIDELMTRTGFENVAARYQDRQFGLLPLERIVAEPPRVLIAGAQESGGYTWADRLVGHPALRDIGTGMQRAEFPEKLLLCGGPVIPQALATLLRIRQGLEPAP